MHPASSFPINPACHLQHNKTCNRYVAGLQPVQPLPQSVLGPTVLHRPSVNLAEDANDSSILKSIKKYTKCWARTPHPTTICHCFETEASQQFTNAAGLNGEGVRLGHTCTVYGLIGSKFAVLRQGPGSSHTVSRFTRKRTSCILRHSTRPLACLES